MGMMNTANTAGNTECMVYTTKAMATIKKETV